MPLGIADAVQGGIGIVQAGLGIVQSISGNARLNRLMKQRTTYTTPQEYYDLNNIAVNNAQTGFSAQSMDYFNTQTDRALSSSLGAVSSLGGDPNTVKNIFDSSVMAIMKNESDNELLRLQKFDKVYSTISTLAEQKTAEWADQQALLKDKMAAAAMKVAGGSKNIQSGLNMALGAVANNESKNTYPTLPQQNGGYIATQQLLSSPTASPYSNITVPSWVQNYQGGTGY